MGFIYRYWLPENNKSYVGQTVGKFSKRDAKHKYDSTKETGNCRLFQRALKKYSYHNFNKEILVECDDSELDKYECDMISKFKALSPFGYNLTSGGNDKKRLSQNTKELLHKLKLKSNDKKFTDYPKEELPFYIIRWRRSNIIKGKLYEYKGYAVRGHTKCKHKFFGLKTLEESLFAAKDYLNKLNNNEIVEKAKEVLPNGIKRRKSGDRDGYEASCKDANGKITKRRFTSKYDLVAQLKRAVDWLNKMQFNDQT